MASPHMAGDLVKCIKEQSELTVGKVYTVIENPSNDDDDSWTYIVQDEGVWNGFNPHIFECVGRIPSMPDPEMSLDDIHAAQALVKG